MARRLLGLAILVVLCGTQPILDGHADAAYMVAVERARAACAAGVDATHAREAAAILQAGTGDSQPEILAALRSSPPDCADARQRLQALEASAAQYRPTPDPDRAAADLRSILSEPRYQGHAKSIVELLVDWITQQLIRLLSLIHIPAPAWGVALLIEVLLVIGVVGGVLVFLVRSGRWLGRRGAPASVAEARRGRTRDWFVEADRLAAAGAWTEALRALTCAVSTALGGEGTWDASPLTVRELFRDTVGVQTLRALLVPFEAAEYGARVPDRETYYRAADVASPFRPATA